MSDLTPAEARKAADWLEGAGSTRSARKLRAQANQLEADVVPADVTRGVYVANLDADDTMQRVAWTKVYGAAVDHYLLRCQLNELAQLKVEDPR